MKETLYRGKTLNGKWVYGIYLPYELDVKTEWCDEDAQLEWTTNDTLHTILEVQQSGEVLIRDVIPETVAQSTGYEDD